MPGPPDVPDLPDAPTGSAAGRFTCHACGAPLSDDQRACTHCGIAAARRRCAACFELNAVADRNCSRCGTLLPPVDTAGARDGAPLDCPGCGAPMAARALAHLSYDECERCGGLWLSPAVLDEFKDRADTRARMRTVDTAHAPGTAQTTHNSHGTTAAAPGSPAAIAYRRCPGCRRMMNRTNIASGSGFVADICRDHGVYFDHGELTRLFAFIESGGLKKARDREVAAAREQVRAARSRAIEIGAMDGMPFEPSDQMRIWGRTWGRPASRVPFQGATSALELLVTMARRWFSGK